MICVCNLIFTRFWFSYYYLNYKNRVKKLNVNYNCLSKRQGTSKCCRKSEIKGLNRGLIIQDIDLEEKYRIINLYRIFNPPGGTSQVDHFNIQFLSISIFTILFLVHCLDSGLFGHRTNRCGWRSAQLFLGVLRISWMKLRRWEDFSWYPNVLTSL